MPRKDVICSIGLVRVMHWIRRLATGDFTDCIAICMPHGQGKHIECWKHVIGTTAQHPYAAERRYYVVVDDQREAIPGKQSGLRSSATYNRLLRQMGMGFSHLPRLSTSDDVVIDCRGHHDHHLWRIVLPDMSASPDMFIKHHWKRQEHVRQLQIPSQTATNLSEARYFSPYGNKATEKLQIACSAQLTMACFSPRSLRAIANKGVITI